MQLESKYISIPNVVMSCESISNDAKLLYGLIRYWDFMATLSVSMEEIKSHLNVSENTVRKCIRELKKANFIQVKIKNNNERYLIPLVSDGVMLVSKEEAVLRNRKALLQDLERKENNEAFKKFFDEIV